MKLLTQYKTGEQRASLFMREGLLKNIYGPRLGFKYFSKRRPDQRLNLKTFKLPKMEM